MPGLIALSISAGRLDGKGLHLLSAGGTFGPDATVPLRPVGEAGREQVGQPHRGENTPRERGDWRTRQQLVGRRRVFRLRGYWVYPRVTSSLCAANAPRTSPFSRSGTGRSQLGERIGVGSTLADTGVMVVAVMDGPRVPLASRVLMPLAVALTVLWSGTGAQPAMGGAPPSAPAVQAAPRLPHGIVAGQLPLVRTAAGHRQRQRRSSTPGAMLAVALASTVVAATRGLRVGRSRHRDRRLPTFGPRAPPFRS